MKRRFRRHAPALVSRLALASDHPAVVEGRTLFRSTVRSASSNEFTLKSGEHSSKVGATIVKGDWAGFPIFTLTLEERATCPVSCNRWRDCYGNHMHMARRFRVDASLYSRLLIELEALSLMHPRGFAVRLHVLGDFPSVDYVKFWIDAVAHHPALHVFGFTHWPRSSTIGRLIEAESKKWDRFRIRLSDQPGERSAVTIDRPAKGRIAEGIVCPAQSDDGRCCANCAFCWSSKEPVVFMLH